MPAHCSTWGLWKKDREHLCITNVVSAPDLGCGMQLLVTGSSVLCQALLSQWLRPRPSCHSGARLGQCPVTATSASSPGMRCWTFENPWN